MKTIFMRFYLFLLCLILSLSAFSQNVGVGTPTPTEKLDVNGNLKADTGKLNVLKIVPNAGNGKILQSDATGNASWANSNATTGSIQITANLSGFAGSALPVSTAGWEFFGPFSTITLTNSQRVVMTMIASLGKSTAGSVAFDLDIGYQFQPGGSLNNASGGNYIDLSPAFPTSASRSSFSMSGSFKPALAGSYKIGAMIRCTTAGYLNNNDFVNGYYMIINE